MVPSLQPQPVDEQLIDLLCKRDGRLTTVVLNDGRQLHVLTIAWGYDWQDTHAHVTTNCSPGARGMRLDFFFTNEVVSVVGDDGSVLYRQ